MMEGITEIFRVSQTSCGLYFSKWQIVKGAEDYADMEFRNLLVGKRYEGI